MPSGVSDVGAAIWLSALFGVSALPTTYRIALCSRQPGDAMDGAMLAGLEPTGDPAYVRQPYGTGGSNWAANGAYLTNLLPVTFPLPGQDWGYLTHFALCTAPTGGQVYAWGELSNPQFVTRSIGMLIPPGGIVLGLHSLNNSIAA
jgi:hypothetical protein